MCKAHTINAGNMLATFVFDVSSNFNVFIPANKGYPCLQSSAANGGLVLLAGVCGGRIECVQDILVIAS